MNLSNATIANSTNLIAESNNFISKIVVALSIFFLGLIIGRIIGKFIERFLKNLKLDYFAKKHTNIKFSLVKFISGLVSLIFYLIFLVLALNYLGLSNILWKIFLVITIIILIIILVLSIKDSIPNMFSYFKILRKNVVKKNDYVTFDNFSGKIKKIGLFQTVVENELKDILLIPNILFLKKKFIRKKK